jgi:hypothetical protein
MQIFDSIFGSIVFEFIGVSAKWIFTNIKDRIQGRKPKTFSELWNGKKKATLQESVERGWSNAFTGIAIILAVIIILKWLTEI